MAPPYSVTEDMNGHKEPEETCYKCKAPGHVRSSPHWVLLQQLIVALQIARDCPEGREPVVEEEDNTWGEIQDQDDPWSGGGAFAAADVN